MSLMCSLACPITAFQMNVQIPLRSTSIGNSLLVWFSPSSQTVLFSLQSNLVTTKMSSANVYPKILFLVLNSLLSFARDFASATFSLSKAPHLRNVVPHSISYESLRKFVHSLLHTISRCYNNNKSPFQVPEFPIFYAISTTLHHDRTSRVHAIACRIR